jgi:hypothetical protein
MEIFETKPSNFFFSYLNQYPSTYTVLHGFANRLGYPFQLRVSVPFEQATALQNYLRVNPHVDPADQSFDRNKYNKQTM